MIEIMIGDNSYNMLLDDNLGIRLIKMKQREKLDIRIWLQLVEGSWKSFFLALDID